MKEATDFVKENKAFLVIGLVLSCLYLLPLLQAGILYRDDFDRVFSGVAWGDHTGRYFADILMRGLSLGRKLTSIFPYSLLLAGAITFFAGVIVSHTLLPNRGMITKVSSLLLLTSPFFLQNLSY